MARKPKPFLHQGAYYTTRGGAWTKLCPAADGPEHAAEVLAELVGTPVAKPVVQTVIERFPAMRPVPAPAAGPTLAAAVAAYLDHARTYYRGVDGKVTSEPTGISGALGYLLRAAPGLTTAQLTKEHLKNARDAMTETCARKSCNKHLSRIKKFVKWLAERDEIPDAVAGGLLLVAPLPAFRSAARETAPVEAVAWADVEATLPQLGEPWRSLVLFQWWSGVRPGEACKLAPEWVDVPGQRLNFGLNHKNGWRGKVKTVAIGPRAVDVLRPWLHAVSLNPRDTVFVTTWTKTGDAPRPCTVCAYDVAVKRAATRAGVKPWHPNQLRHAFATRVRAEAGLESAQVLLVHAHADTTQIYAERNEKTAADLARRFG